LAADPGAIMKELCRRLEVRFDRHFTERWSSYASVTGDVAGSRSGCVIQLPPRRSAEPLLLDQLAASADYRTSLELLGYAHPGSDGP
jgi:hypothetical protein